MMTGFKSLSGQLRAIYPGLLLILLLSCLGIGGVILLNQWKGISIYILTQDTVAVVKRSFITGFLSNLGMLVWSGAATICLFSAVQLTNQGYVGRFMPFLYATGLFTVLLMLDDLFLIHESVMPQYFAVPEKVVLGSYAVLGLLYAIYFQRLIREGPYLLFGLAILGFAISIAVDIFLEGRGKLIYEEGAKFVGMVSWLVYCAYVAAFALRHLPTASPIPSHYGQLKKSL